MPRVRYIGPDPTDPSMCIYETETGQRMRIPMGIVSRGGTSYGPNAGRQPDPVLNDPGHRAPAAIDARESRLQQALSGDIDSRHLSPDERMEVLRRRTINTEARIGSLLESHDKVYPPSIADMRRRLGLE